MKVTYEQFILNKQMKLVVFVMVIYVKNSAKVKLAMMPMVMMILMT